MGDIQQRVNPVGLTTLVIGYFFLAIANLLFNGLLCLHVLLDNPFGSNPLQFALRSETTHLIKCAATPPVSHQPSIPSRIHQLVQPLRLKARAEGEGRSTMPMATLPSLRQPLAMI